MATLSQETEKTLSGQPIVGLPSSARKLMIACFALILLGEACYLRSPPVHIPSSPTAPTRKRSSRREPMVQAATSTVAPRLVGVERADRLGQLAPGNG